METGVLASCGPSSIRYKEQIREFSPGLDLVRRLRPVSFRWKDGGQEDFGFIAEEVNQVEPRLVIHNKEGQVDGVKYDRLSVVLVNALHEQQAQIESLRQSVTNLQRQNEQMAKRWRTLTHAPARAGMVRKVRRVGLADAPRRSGGRG